MILSAPDQKPSSQSVDRNIVAVISETETFIGRRGEFVVGANDSLRSQLLSRHRHSMGNKAQDRRGEVSWPVAAATRIHHACCLLLLPITLTPILRRNRRLTG